MDILLIVGGVVLGLFVAFLYAALQLARDPDPPSPLDPETRLRLRRLAEHAYDRHQQAPQIQCDDSATRATHHAPASRREWEGGHDDVA